MQTKINEFSRCLFPVHFGETEAAPPDHLSCHKKYNGDKSTIVQNITLSSDLRLLVPNFSMSNRKWKPQVTGHRTRLFFYLYQYCFYVCIIAVILHIDV